MREGVVKIKQHDPHRVRVYSSNYNFITIHTQFYFCDLFILNKNLNLMQINLFYSLLHQAQFSVLKIVIHTDDDHDKATNNKKFNISQEQV